MFVFSPHALNIQLNYTNDKRLQNFSAQTNSVTEQMSPCSTHVSTHCMYVVQDCRSLLNVRSLE